MSAVNCLYTVDHLTRHTRCVHLVTQMKTEMDMVLLHVGFRNRQVSFIIALAAEKQLNVLKNASFHA